MPVIKREFIPNAYQDPLTGEIEFIFQPKITIFIKINGLLYPFKIDAYVDSGAVRNLFPADPLKYFNIKLDNGRKREHYGIGGKSVLSFTHDVQILVDKFTINTEIDFSSEHKPPLLGTDKFFNYFNNINFNISDKLLELSYH